MALPLRGQAESLSSPSIPGSGRRTSSILPPSRLSRCPGLSTFVSQSQTLGPECGVEEETRGPIPSSRSSQVRGNTCPQRAPNLIGQTQPLPLGSPQSGGDVVLVLGSSRSDGKDASPALSSPCDGRVKTPALRDLQDTILRRTGSGSQDRKGPQDRAQQPTVPLQEVPSPRGAVSS